MNIEAEKKIRDAFAEVNKILDTKNSELSSKDSEIANMSRKITELTIRAEQSENLLQKIKKTATDEIRNAYNQGFMEGRRIAMGSDTPLGGTTKTETPVKTLSVEG